MKNIKIRLMFDGTNYHGFQRQKNALTIQQCLETAVNKACGERASIIGCSRTDSGVHASMYVANFLSSTKIPLSKLPLALNAYLNNDIKIVNAEYMPIDFNARKHALYKTYKYTIVNGRYENVFLRHYSWFYPSKLDVGKMQKASAHLCGKHDFRTFMAAGGSAKTFVRSITKLQVAEEENNVIKIAITGDGFLYNMVRIIAGTLVYVGNGKIQPDDMPNIINSFERSRAGITAPPQGLMLTNIKY